MVEKINFDNDEKYQAILFDENGNEIYRGIMNSKAFSKTIENSTLWEYISDNGRVIEKEFLNKKLDLNKTEFNNGIINFYIKKIDDGSFSSSNIDIKEILFELERIIEKRKNELPENSYTTHLFKKGEDKILKKLGEETIELIISSKEKREDMIYESADLIYHILVFLSFKDIKFEEILNELRKRML